MSFYDYFNKTSLFKITITIVVFLLMIGLGDIRRQYLLNFTLPEEPFFMPRPNTYSGDFPQKVNVIPYFFLNPKWISSLIYILAFLLLNILAVYFYFYNKGYVKITIVFYLGIIILCFMIIIIGNAFGFSKEAYSAMENFKELLSSPFIAMMLFSAFLLNNKLNLL